MFLKDTATQSIRFNSEKMLLGDGFMKRNQLNMNASIIEGDVQ